MAGHRHYWRPQSTVFMQNGLGNCIAAMWNCECGSVQGYYSNSGHKDAAELGYELERAGDLFLEPGERAWLEERRKLCPV